MRLLCLSNGHGEDAIAIRILQALQQLPSAPTIEALPLVGKGHAYTRARIPLIGAVKTMPSGGFIYMDSKQLARDIRGGLLQLTLAQRQAIQRWSETGKEQKAKGKRNPQTTSQIAIHDSQATSDSFILAVGDIVPMIFAWLSGLPYAFVGTAKSEYYIRDEAGMLPRESWWSDRLERSTGCIYHPWERWLMSRPNCKAVFPRDSITAQNLRRFGIPAFDMGNPMMDGLVWEGKRETSEVRSSSELSTIHDPPSTNPSPALTIALLPGSRPLEAYANWQTILLAVNGLIAQTDRPLMLLATIAPGLDLEELEKILLGFRWQKLSEHSFTVGLGAQQATLVLATDRFAEFLHRADAAIAMAGTATEQFVGLGKPAFLIPGLGPQFTPEFAEAYTRLLGPSVILVSEPDQVAREMRTVLQNPDLLQLIAVNGCRRMGEPGAAARIARCLLEQME